MTYFGIYKDDDIVVPATVIEDIFHYAVHEGLGFSVSQVGGTGDKFICFKTPNTDNYLHLLWKFGSQENANFHIWEGVTPAAVTNDVVVYNKNRASAMTSATSAVLAGNSETVGSVQADNDWTGGTTVYSEFAAKGGGSDNDVAELLLEKNTWYGVELDTANKESGMTLLWFEVPNAT